MQEKVCQRPREHQFQVDVCGFGCCAPPFFVIRVHVSSMSSPLSALCLHFPSCGVCRCLLLVNVVHAFFSLSELSVHLRLAAGWSPAVISLFHHFLVASVGGVCCQSGLCTFLCSLSSRSAFVSQLDCHFLLPFLRQLIFLYRCALGGLLFDFDIQGQVH